MKRDSDRGTRWGAAACALVIAVVVSSTSAIAEDAPSSSAAQPLPKGELISRDETFYPAKAKRLGQEGRVLIAFDIGANGLVTNPVVVSTEESALNSAALAVVRNVKYAVSEASTGRPYRMGVAFCLAPSGQPVNFDEGIARTIITGSRIPGSTPKIPWKEGSARECR